MILDFENIEDFENVWVIGFITMPGCIFDSQTFFKIPHLFADFVFQASNLLINIVINKLAILHIFWKSNMKLMI